MLLTLVMSVDVNVMMSLTTINQNGVLTDKTKLMNDLKNLKKTGVAGLMIDVWWGIVEKLPNVYNFDGYEEFVQIAASLQYKVQAVMSFHKCGGNVGDECNIPLPTWVSQIASDKKLYYTDQDGIMQDEYLSNSADDQRIFPGSAQLRTPIDMYSDFMQAFALRFSQYLKNKTINNIQVGVGPASEMRYPSYPSAQWHFPGVGRFQAFDPLFQTAAAKKNIIIPKVSGTYNSLAKETDFFTAGYKTPQGEAFLNFYEEMLFNHTAKIQHMAEKAFFNTVLSIKVSGIHWMYAHPSHAAELTAGYINLNRTINGYDAIIKVLGPKVHFDFTCLEMKNSQQEAKAESRPENLVRQVMDAVKRANTTMGGENALPVYDKAGYDQITAQIKYAGKVFEQFTYLRMTDTLFEQKNFDQFKKFVEQFTPITTGAIIGIVCGSLAIVIAIIIVVVVVTKKKNSETQSLIDNDYT